MTTPLRQGRRLSRDPIGGASVGAIPPRRRTSSQGSHGGHSSIPLPSRNGNARLANTQATYDFIGGQGNSPPPSLGQSLRPSQARPDAGNEEIRAQLKTLQYEVEALRQERELVRLRHAKEVRDAQTQAEADFKRAQASESSKHVTTQKYDALARDLAQLQETSSAQQATLERKLRVAQDEAGGLREELEEVRSEHAGAEREQQYRQQQLDAKHAALQKSVDSMRAELEAKTHALQAAEERISSRDADVGTLEGELLRLRSRAGDAEDLATVKRELTDQVEHMRRLERVNREQGAELRTLRQSQRAVTVVEEEKRGLETRLCRMADLERELAETELQRQILLDERAAWTAYLKPGNADDAVEFNSPQAVLKALTAARLEHASLLDRLGSVQPELGEKDSIIQNLEDERSRLRVEVEKLKTGGSGSGSGSDARIKARLERQKGLAIKEVEYLREQLRTFDNEDATVALSSDADTTARKRIADLEVLLAEYRGELQTMAESMARLEAEAANGTSDAVSLATSLKRAHPDNEDDTARTGQLARKLRKLQAELTSVQSAAALQATELAASKAQLTGLQSTARTRVLALRNNPTDDFAALRRSTVATLRQENADLLAMMKSKKTTLHTVPASSLEAAQQRSEELTRTIASRDTTIARLKAVWAAKSLELREAVAALLGWDVVLLGGGRFRLAPVSSAASSKSATALVSTEEALIFDGDSGTMKFSGGADGLLARELRPLVRFWMEERRDVPAFLAAATLEFYERSTRAAHALGTSA